MGMNLDTTWAQIRFPRTQPVEGHFASISLLEQGGFCRPGDTYQEFLVRAGFVCVETRDGPALDVSPEARGLFAAGVGPAALAFLDALAAEGFEGELRVQRAGAETGWSLLNGRVFPDFCLPEMRMAA